MKILKELNAINIIEKGIKENLKSIFSNKKDIADIYNTKDNCYSFSYIDTIKELFVKLRVNIYLSTNNNIINFEIETEDVNISEVDLEVYYYQSIYEYMTKDYLHENTNKYTIRVYYKILHDTGFDGEYIINWKNKIRFKQLFNEKSKSAMGERIVSVDCEVNAKSLTHARSKAINLTKEFISYLSLLIDIGFYEMQTKFAHYIRKDGNYLINEYQRHSFIDDELGLIVMDNMNGLRHKIDYSASEIQIPSFLSLHKLNENSSIIGSSYIKNSNDNNKNLENLFLKDFKIEKSQVKNNYRNNINCSPYYSLEVLIPQQIRKYYNGILSLNDEQTKYFRNASRLYNISQTCGVYEPTLMLAYMVSSVECLAKSENKSFSNFSKDYLKDEYNKELCDFLYGNLRSGHFHSGEMFFTEYNIELDITLEPNFQSMINIFNNSKYILRKILIEWINTNILNNI